MTDSGIIGLEGKLGKDDESLKDKPCEHIYGLTLTGSVRSVKLLDMVKERFDFCPKCGTPLQRYFYDNPLESK